MGRGSGGPKDRLGLPRLRFYRASLTGCKIKARGELHTRAEKSRPVRRPAYLLFDPIMRLLCALLGRRIPPHPERARHSPSSRAGHPGPSAWRVRSGLRGAASPRPMTCAPTSEEDEAAMATSSSIFRDGLHGQSCEEHPSFRHLTPDGGRKQFTPDVAVAHGFQPHPAFPTRKDRTTPC